jgi:hypothetical protein
MPKSADKSVPRAGARDEVLVRKAGLEVLTVLDLLTIMHFLSFQSVFFLLDWFQQVRRFVEWSFSRPSFGSV